MPLETLAADTSLDTILQVVERDGTCIINDVLSHSIVNQIKRRYQC